MICSASSGNCVLDGEVCDGDVGTHANNSFDPSGSSTGSEESSTKTDDTDSFKLYVWHMLSIIFNEGRYNTLLQQTFRLNKLHDS